MINYDKIIVNDYRRLQVIFIDEHVYLCVYIELKAHLEQQKEKEKDLVESRTDIETRHNGLFVSSVH